MERLFYSIITGCLVGVAMAAWIPPAKMSYVVDRVMTAVAAAQSEGAPPPNRSAPPSQPAPQFNRERLPLDESAVAEDSVLGEPEAAIAGDGEDRPLFEAPPIANGPEAAPDIGPAAEDYVPPPGGRAFPTIGWQDKIGRPEQFESAQIIGRVGNEVVLARDVLPFVNEVMAPYEGRMPADEAAVQRRILMAQRTKMLLETKMLLIKAREKIPKEGWDNITKQLDKEFENKEIKSLLKRAKVATRAELIDKLRSLGSSLELEKRAYSERMIAGTWVQQQIKLDEEISHEELVAYYRDHIADYEHEAKARWEQIMVRFDKFPDKRSAWNELARLGNQVQSGAPFAEVAKAHSHGTTAYQGGLRNWTTKGSLASHVLDQALFQLPLNQLSPILEDKTGFHIIRVIERVDRGRTPFEETQKEIRKKIYDQRRSDQVKDYLTKVKKNVTLWTIFDQDKELQELAPAGQQP